MMDGDLRRNGPGGKDITDALRKEAASSLIRCTPAR
jgi:hypothetical protein